MGGSESGGVHPRRQAPPRVVRHPLDNRWCTTYIYGMDIKEAQAKGLRIINADVNWLTKNRDYLLQLEPDEHTVAALSVRAGDPLIPMRLHKAVQS
jgi:hypothetical protein